MGGNSVLPIAWSLKRTVGFALKKSWTEPEEELSVTKIAEYFA